MKKVLNVLVAALVSVAFAGVVCAAEVKTETKAEGTVVSPSAEVKVEKAVSKKAVKRRKSHSGIVRKAAPAKAPTPAAR